MCPPVMDSTQYVPPHRCEQQDRGLSSISSVVLKDNTSWAAFQYARKHLHPAILNHSLRVHRYAKATSDQEENIWSNPKRLPRLFVTCVMHGIGTTAVRNGPLRFEVEGANAAQYLLESHGILPQHCHNVWWPSLSTQVLTLRKTSLY